MKGLDLKCITACNLIWKWLWFAGDNLEKTFITLFFEIFIIIFLIKIVDGQQQLFYCFAC